MPNEKMCLKQFEKATPTLNIQDHNTGTKQLNAIVFYYSDSGYCSEFNLGIYNQITQAMIPVAKITDTVLLNYSC